MFRMHRAVARECGYLAAQTHPALGVTESWPRACGYYSVSIGMQTVTPPVVPFLAVAVYLMVLQVHLLVLKSVSATFQWSETCSPCISRSRGKFTVLKLSCFSLFSKSLLGGLALCFFGMQSPEKSMLHGWDLLASPPCLPGAGFAREAMTSRAGLTGYSSTYEILFADVTESARAHSYFSREQVQRTT